MIWCSLGLPRGDTDRDQGKPTAKKAVALHHAPIRKVCTRVSPDRALSIYEIGSSLAGDQERFGQTIAETVSARGEKPGAELLLRKLSKVLIALSSFRRSDEFFSTLSRQRCIASYASTIRNNCTSGLRSRIAARYFDHHISFKWGVLHYEEKAHVAGWLQRRREWRKSSFVRTGAQPFPSFIL